MNKRFYIVIGDVYFKGFGNKWSSDSIGKTNSTGNPTNPIKRIQSGPYALFVNDYDKCKKFKSKKAARQTLNRFYNIYGKKFDNVYILDVGKW